MQLGNMTLWLIGATLCFGTMAQAEPWGAHSSAPATQPQKASETSPRPPGKQQVVLNRLLDGMVQFQAPGAFRPLPLSEMGVPSRDEVVDELKILEKQEYDQGRGRLLLFSIHLDDTDLQELQKLSEEEMLTAVGSLVVAHFEEEKRHHCEPDGLALARPGAPTLSYGKVHCRLFADFIPNIVKNARVPVYNLITSDQMEKAMEEIDFPEMEIFFFKRDDKIYSMLFAAEAYSFGPTKNMIDDSLRVSP